SIASIEPPLYPPLIVHPVEIKHEIPERALATPVVTAVTVVPPVAGQSFRPDRSLDREPPPTPRHRARHPIVADDEYRFRRFEQPNRGIPAFCSCALGSCALGSRAFCSCALRPCPRPLQHMCIARNRLHHHVRPQL